MSTVRLYKVTCTKAPQMYSEGSGYTMTPWGGDNEYYEGYDDGGHDYVLPDGWSVGTASYDGAPLVIGPDGGGYDIGTRNGRPCIVTSREYLMLKRV